MAASRTQLSLYLATAAVVLLAVSGCGPENPVPPQIRPDPPPIAGTGTISGFVRDAQMQLGQGGIVVRVRRGTDTVGLSVTQANGRYFVTGLPLEPVQVDLDARPDSGFADRNNVATVPLDTTPRVETDLIIFTIFDVPPGPGT